MKKINYVIISLMMLMIILSNSSFKSLNVEAENINGLSAKSYIVIDDNGKVLIENNADEKREVASICKLMTTLITLEEIDKGNLSLDDKVVASSYACSVEGSQAFLDAGSEYSVKDLIKSVIVASANDSAIVLAESIAGSEENFVVRMNNRAKEIGMKDTLYENSTGLHVNEQYSTAKDTAIILNKISDYELYKEDSKIWLDTLIHPSGRKTELVNTNRLIKYYPSCITGKTGFTDEAGYCLSSTAIKNDLKLTCVVLGCDSSANRFSDSISLYNKVYADFKSEKVITKDVIIDNNISVLHGKDEKIEVVAEDDYYLTLSKNNTNNFLIEFEFVNEVKAPINKGEIVGSAKIILDDEVVGEVNLVSNTYVEEQSFNDIWKKITNLFGFLN